MAQRGVDFGGFAVRHQRRQIPVVEQTGSIPADGTEAAISSRPYTVRAGTAPPAIDEDTLAQNSPVSHARHGWRDCLACRCPDGVHLTRPRLANTAVEDIETWFTVPGARLL